MAEYGEPLSERELEILAEIATGATNREIAYTLNISPNTVKVHLRNIFTKLGAESRTEATVIAVKQGLVNLPAPVDEGAEEVAAALHQEAVPEPLPPLAWPRRIALVVAALAVLLATVVAWPRASQAVQAPGDVLPPRIGGEDGGTSLVGDATHWSEMAQMPTRRAGLALAAWNHRLYAIGGEGPDGTTGVVEVYNPQSNVWQRAAGKPTPVAYASAGVVDGAIYVPGGCTDSGAAIATLEVYNPTSDSWSEAAPLPTPLCAYALAVYDGRIYLFGGTNGNEAFGTTLAYSPQEDRWEALTSLPDARTAAAAAVLNERIYVVGGYAAGRELNACAVYVPEEDRWDACAPLTIARSGLGLAPIGGWVYTIGGGDYLGFNERYDPRTDYWTAIDTPITGIWQSPGVAQLDSAIYAMGGWSNDYLGLNLAFEPLPIQLFLPITEG
ncbi:MAG: hypothetical protein JXD18_05145 [Anaerolineae bacterium]|nr:hypothetical protein [Anaerolineae bacterium]